MNPQGLCRAQRPVPAAGPRSVGCSLSRPSTASPQAGWERGGGQLGWPCSHRGAACSSEGQREDSAAGGAGLLPVGNTAPQLRLRPARQGHGSCQRGRDVGHTAVSRGWRCPGAGQSQPQNVALALISGPVSTSRGESRDQSAGSSKGRAGSGKEAPGSTPAPAAPALGSAISVPHIGWTRDPREPFQAEKSRDLFIPRKIGPFL